MTRADLLAVHRAAAGFFSSHVQRSWVPGYLRGRSLDAALGEPWTAGYAPSSWTALTDHLGSAGWSDAVLEASGLSRRARTGNLIDTFRDRLVLPVRVASSASGQDGAGDVVAFIGRARPGAADRVPKYFNSPRTALYDKASILFGLLEGRAALGSGATPVLVEGPLDALAVTHATNGRYVGMAPCGTALTAGHVTALASGINLARSGVVVATDQDDAGLAAAVRAYERLSPLTPGLLRAELEDGADPADLLHRRGREALLAALTEDARPLVETVIDARLQPWADQLQWVEGRVGAARAVAPVLAALPDAQRDRHARSLARRLDLGTTTVQQVVAAASLTPTGRTPHGRRHTAHPSDTAPPPARPRGTPTSTAPPPPVAVPSRRFR